MSWFKKNKDSEAAAPMAPPPAPAPAPAPQAATLAPHAAPAMAMTPPPAPVMPQPAAAPMANGHAALAKLGGIELSESALKRMFAMLSPAERERALNQPEMLAGIVRNELWRAALRARAAAEGFDKSPDAQWQAQRAADHQIAALYLAATAKPDLSVVSDAAVRAHYDRNAAQFIEPTMVRLAQVFVAVAKGAPDAQVAEARAKAEAVAARAATEDFATLAAAMSQHEDSARKGGELGWIAENRLSPELQPHVNAAQQGELIGPIQGGAGFHVIKVLERRPGQQIPFETVKAQLADALERRASELARQSFVRTLLREGGLAMDQSRLKQILQSLG